jgi:hypothetical protein
MKSVVCGHSRACWVALFLNFNSMSEPWMRSLQRSSIVRCPILPLLPPCRFHSPLKSGPYSRRFRSIISPLLADVAMMIIGTPWRSLAARTILSTRESAISARGQSCLSLNCNLSRNSSRWPALFCDAVRQQESSQNREERVAALLNPAPDFPPSQILSHRGNAKRE